MHSKRGGLAVMGRLIGLLTPLLPLMLLAILMGTAGFLCAIGIPVLGGLALLDALAFDVPLSRGWMIALVLIFALVRGLLRYAEQACNHYIAFKLLARIRDRVFGALRRLAPAKLEGRDKGDLIAVITSDIELLEVFYAHTISPIGIAVAVSALMCAFIGSYHTALGLVAAAAYLTVGLLLPLLIARADGGRAAAHRGRAGELNAYVLDSLRGLRESLQYGAAGERRQSLDDRTDALLGEEAAMKRTTGRGAAVTGALVLTFSMLMLLVSSLLYAGGSLGFGGVLIATVAMISSFGPVIALAGLGSGLQPTLAAGNRVLDILDETPAVPETMDGTDIRFDGAACREVGFSYGGKLSSARGEAILTDFSLDIPAGRFLGIVGRSGSGKSTLLKLLMRFWDVQEGSVSLSDTDIRRVNTASLRDCEGYMTQETHLFHDTVGENIRLVRPEATQAEVEAACRKASLHDFIVTLPQGYDTPVGELGETLSGGERQRIGLARAFLHDAPFLLLDEPTSNLDSLNEAVILRSLREEKGEKTVVLVTHRASTARIADTVFTMESGRMS